ncbi:D-alanyl-D-alanine carboxypeptidase [hydrothermal vent metagenome]|uniref:serine-type D-Ala-D-Ala carboxypeptidase n=1 Tax=hydrothermal vent metagenome TaxID=652676 RepID=A0A3B0TJK2_9ZZZZ
MWTRRKLSWLALGLAGLGAVFSAALVAPATAQIAFQTKAKFAILIDAESGATLYEKDADTLMSPASMSKLMTMIMVFEALQRKDLNLTDEFLISENAWRTGGASSGSSTMYADLNSTVPLEDLIRGVIVQSGNDASIAIAEGMFGTEAAFAEAMTVRARKLGLSKSTFANATGWPDEDHKTTARELAQLARYIIYNLSEYYPYYSETEFTWNGIKQRNRNPLLYQNMGADGLKTGFTEESGYGLVASAVQKGRRLIVVVNGIEKRKDRATETRKLLDWGFRSFKQFVLFDVDEQVGTASVWGGEKGKVKLKAKGRAMVSVQQMARSSIKAKIVYQGPVRAPVKEGDRIGVLRVTATNQGPTEIPLYAAEDVAEGTNLRKALDAVGSLVTGNFSFE